MNTELKITKGVWRNPEGTTFITCGSKQMIDYAGYKTTEEEDDANAQLIIDAGNTIQSCGLLPSQLLKQRNELLEALKESQNMLMGVDWSENEGFPECKSVFERNEKLIESTNP